ncbi:hypothetical protein QQO25_09620 [Corynebacterium lehmanniae]|nr:hypothetical protein [Corynebacterium lehmanniae]
MQNPTREWSRDARLAASVALAAGLSLSAITSPAQAAETPQTGAYVVGAETRQKLSPEDVQFVKNVSKAGPTFVDEEGKIATTASDRELSDNYGFSDQDLERLHESVLGKPMNLSSSSNDAPISSSSSTTPVEYAYRDGSSVCFTHNDLLVGAGAAIVAAADAGPVALAAALEAAATAFGGPVGTAIGFVLAAASAPSLVELGGRAVTAVATNRGLKIGVQADYPPVYSDYC